MICSYKLLFFKQVRVMTLLAKISGPKGAMALGMGIYVTLDMAITG